MLERKFFNSFYLFLDTYLEWAELMVAEVDRNGRTPLIVAKEVDSLESMQRIETFMRNHQISFRFGLKPANKAKVDLLEAYVKYGYSSLLDEVHQEIDVSSEENANFKLNLLKSALQQDQAVKFYNSFVSTLKRSPTYEDFSDGPNHENILHTLVK